jgi:hypothetical protein
MLRVDFFHVCVPPALQWTNSLFVADAPFSVEISVATGPHADGMISFTHACIRDPQLHSDSAGHIPLTLTFPSYPDYLSSLPCCQSI